MATIKLIDGEITFDLVEVDAFITTINPEGLWYGGYDKQIRRVAGNMFHGQLPEPDVLEDGQAILVRSNARHGGKFTDVIFVIDSLTKHISDLVSSALEEADRQHLSSVCMHPFRSNSVALNYNLGLRDSHIDSFVKAIIEFANRADIGIREINIVVDVKRDEEILETCFSN